MKQSSTLKIKRNFTNFFGATGYLFCLLQWFWAVMLYFSVVQTVTTFVASDNPEPASNAHAAAFTLPDPVNWTIAIIVTIVMSAITVYALVKLPMKVVKASNRMVHRSAESVAPVIIRVQHKKPTEKQRMRITPKIILLIKLFLVVVPIGLTVASVLLEKQYVDYSIATAIGYGLAVLTIGAFAMQYLLFFLFRLTTRELW